MAILQVVNDRDLQNVRPEHVWLAPNRALSAGIHDLDDSVLGVHLFVLAPLSGLPARTASLFIDARV
jgi:hypothetical protein